MNVKSNVFILTTVFVTNFCIMAIEMSASRLIAPFWGSTLPVWSVLIGSLLLFLTAGYFIGGKLADKYDNPYYAYMLIMAAGVFTFITALLGPSMLGHIGFNPFGIIRSLIYSPLFTLFIFVISMPVILLGCVSPYLLKTSMIKGSNVGNTAGKIYAISSLGSIVGTLMPAFIFIPLLGTKMSFGIIAVLMITLGSLVLKKYITLLLVASSLVVFFFIPKAIKHNHAIIEEKESAYNYIQVQRFDRCSKGGFLLKVNEGLGIYSYYCPSNMNYRDIYNVFAMLPFYVSDKPENFKLLIIGLAGGISANHYRHLYPGVDIDGVEIDKEILSLGRKYLHLDEFIPREQQYAMDARPFLANASKKYDFIIIDAFHHTYVPFYLATVEFFELIKQHLSPNGIVAINVPVIPNPQLSSRVLASLDKVFAHTGSINLSAQNVMLASSELALDHNRIGSKLSAGQSFDRIKAASEPLTDDKAPVESVFDTF